MLALFWIGGMAFIVIDDGMRSAFKEDTSNFHDYTESWEQFTPTENDIAVVFSAPTFADFELLARVREFALEARFASHVADSYSIFSLRSPPDTKLVTAPLLPADLEDVPDLTAVFAAIRAHPLGGARLLSADHAHTLVLVTLERDQSAIEPARQTLAELQDIAEALTANSALEFGISGLVPIRQIVIDGILGDMLFLNAIGMIIGMVVCLIVLRSISVALLTMVAPAVALMAVLGSMGWAGLAFNTLTNAIPVLVLVIALADSLHMTAEYRRARASGAGAKTAIVSTLEDIGPACALTSFTTALAFAALLISGSELVRSFAWAGILATLLALAVVLVVHPLAFLMAARSSTLETQIESASEKPWRVPNGLWLQRLGERYPWTISFGAVVVLLFALAAFAAARPEYTFLENVSPGNSALINLHMIESELTPTATIDFRVKTAEQDPFSPDSLERLSRVEDAVRSILPDIPTVSLLDFVDWARANSDAMAPAREMFSGLSKVQQGRFVAKDNSAVILRAFVRDEGATTTVEMLDQLAIALERVGVSGHLVSPPTGLLAMSGRASVRMIRHLNISFAIAVLASGILIAVWFRNVAYGIVALLPNILPIALIGAWLWVSGNGLQFSSAIALTIAFGIAVDDTMHVMNRLRRTAPAGAPFDLATIRAAYHHLTPVLVSTTMILGIGILGTQWSIVPTIAYFGILTACVLFLALVSVLLVLPAILAVAEKILGGKDAPS